MSIQEQDVPPENIGRTSKLSRLLKVVLDEWVTVPGTKFRVGLDPFLGLIPGWGETVATVLGSSILFEGVRRGVPVRTVLKMVANTAINALAGVVPGLGDVFSAWFKSNSRNYQLILDNSTPKGRPTWLILVVGILGIVFCIALSVSLGLLTLWLIARFFGWR